MSTTNHPVEPVTCLQIGTIDTESLTIMIAETRTPADLREIGTELIYQSDVLAGRTPYSLRGLTLPQVEEIATLVGWDSFDLLQAIFAAGETDAAQLEAVR